MIFQRKEYRGEIIYLIITIENIETKPINEFKTTKIQDSINRLMELKPLSDEIKMQEDEVEKAEWVQINEAGKCFDGYYSDAWGELLNRLNNC